MKTVQHFEISDIFYGSYAISQKFGNNPDYYSRFGLLGHNGLDFSCTFGTPALSPRSSRVLDIGVDQKGYGLYVKLLFEGYNYFFIYAHLLRTFVKKGDILGKFEVIGLTGNSGVSTGPHLHFGVARCDSKGNKLEPNNGYSGYIDPLSSHLFNWKIEDPRRVFCI